MVNLNLNGLLLRGRAIPISVDVFYKEYFDESYTLVATGVPVASDGTIQASPSISISVDQTIDKHLVKAENLLCNYVYEQVITINPYCEIGYAMSADRTYCYREFIVEAIPPSSPEMAVAKTGNPYSTCGSYIYEPGFNVNGTGTSNQIDLANPFWKNGGLCVDNNTVDGPMNRSAIWATTEAANQTVGFAQCLEIEEDKTVYCAIGCDNRGIIKVDGEVIVDQNIAALTTQYGNAGACFKVWHIYPIALKAGSRIVELIGFNIASIAGLGCEIYDNTAAEIIAATSYGDLNLLFSSKDFVGQPIQLGSNGLGYVCPDGYALNYCGSPIACRRIETVPVRY